MAHTEKRIRKSVWIVGAVSIVAVCACIYLVKNHNTQNQNSSASASSETSELSDVTVTAESYDVYKLDDVDFSFIIAQLHVKASTNVSISLNQFATSEGIKLGDVSEYIDALDQKSYSLSSENLVTSLSSSENEFDAKVLIPVKDKSAGSISVACSFNSADDMKFDLSKAKTSAENLKVDPAASTAAATAEASADTARQYAVNVDYAGEANNDDVLGKNDAASFLPSAARVLMFHVSVSAAQGQPVTITSAELDTNDYGSMPAENADTHTARNPSILNQTITETGDGYIFVIILDAGHEITSVNGTLKLQMADQSQNKEVEVSIQ